MTERQRHTPEGKPTDGPGGMSDVERRQYELDSRTPGHPGYPEYHRRWIENAERIGLEHGRAMLRQMKEARERRD